MYLRSIILFILFPVFGFAQIQIEGNILDKIKNTPLPDARVILSAFIRDTLVIVDSTGFHPFQGNFVDSIYLRQDQLITDSTGYFLFKNLKPGVYKVSAEGLLNKSERGAYYEEYSSVLCSIKEYDKTIYLAIYLSVFCPFDSTKDLSLCPKCGGGSDVHVFVWGLPSYRAHDDGSKYIYTGDCSPPRCRPSKYCSRCKLEF